MNEMRYAKSNAKDYAQHSHPIKALSAAVIHEYLDTNFASSNKILQSSNFLSVFVIDSHGSGAWKI